MISKISRYQILRRRSFKLANQVDRLPSLINAHCRSIKSRSKPEKQKKESALPDASALAGDISGLIDPIQDCWSHSINTNPLDHCIEPARD